MMEALVHQRQLDSSVLFMQQEHANTLKALHEEIQKLQKKCTGLTFQLTMHGIDVKNEGSKDGDLEYLHQQLNESQLLERSVHERLVAGEAQMKQLQQDLKDQQRAHDVQMRQMSKKVSSLKAEVEAKSGNIAFLTTQIHALKVKQRAQQQQQQQGQQGHQHPGVAHAEVRGQQGSLSHSHPGEVRNQPGEVRAHVSQPNLPAPLRESLHLHLDRHQQRVPAHNAHSRSLPNPAPAPTIPRPQPSAHHAEMAMVGGPQPLRMNSPATRSSSGSDTPDITPFMQRERTPAPPVVEVKRSTPLPPITPSSSTHSPTSSQEARATGKRPRTLPKPVVTPPSSAHPNHHHHHSQEPKMSSHRGPRAVGYSRSSSSSFSSSQSMDVVDGSSSSSSKNQNQSPKSGMSHRGHRSLPQAVAKASPQDSDTHPDPVVASHKGSKVLPQRRPTPTSLHSPNQDTSPNPGTNPNPGDTVLVAAHKESAAKAIPQKRSTPTSSSNTEVTSLAVDQVSDGSWKRPTQPSSESK